MIRAAGMGIAMGGASEAVKSVADYIALSMFISFLVVAFLGTISNANYICKDCNKRFHHK